MSRIVAILLMLILPLHVLAAAGQQFAHSATTMPNHLVMHAEQISHHHDDDGDIQIDDSTSSASHQLDFDYGSHFQGTVTMPYLLPVLPHVQLAPEFHGSAVPNPTGSPPLRPPHLPA